MNDHPGCSLLSSGASYLHNDSSVSVVATNQETTCKETQLLLQRPQYRHPCMHRHHEKAVCSVINVRMHTVKLLFFGKDISLA